MKTMTLMRRFAGNKWPTISAQANLREQVKPRSGGRSQKTSTKGMPA